MGKNTPTDTSDNKILSSWVGFLKNQELIRVVLGLLSKINDL